MIKWDKFFVTMISTALFIFIGVGFFLGEVMRDASRHVPAVGDVYVEYYDYRQDAYAITNGFPLQPVTIYQVVAVTNGEVFCRTESVALATNKPNELHAWNEYGPIENYYKYADYRHFVPPAPQD